MSRVTQQRPGRGYWPVAINKSADGRVDFINSPPAQHPVHGQFIIVQRRRKRYEHTVKRIHQIFQLFLGDTTTPTPRIVNAIDDFHDLIKLGYALDGRVATKIKLKYVRFYLYLAQIKRTYNLQQCFRTLILIISPIYEMTAFISGRAYAKKTTGRRHEREAIAKVDRCTVSNRLPLHPIEIAICM